MPRNKNSHPYSHVPPATLLVKEDRHSSDRKQRPHNYPEASLLKRVPLERLMDLKIDYAFKQLFGKEESKAITVVFINSFLQKTGHQPITDIWFDNSEESAEYEEDKSSRLDILAVTKNGKRINIEIQFTNQFDMVNRSIYYWSGLYRRQMKKGSAYDELQTVIAINIMNYNYFKQTERFLTMYHLYEDIEKFQVTDIMEFHFVEMPKLIAAWKKEQLDPWSDVLARWLLLLGIVDRKNRKIYEDILKELEEVAMKDEKLQSAFASCEELSMSDKEFFEYEGRMKKILDEQSALRAAERRGREQGMEQGIEQGIKKGMEETAKKLVMREFSMEEIIDITGLSKKRVLELKQELMGSE